MSDLFTTIQSHIDTENYSQGIQVILDALPSTSDDKQRQVLTNSLSSLYLTNNQPEEALKYSQSLPYNNIYALYRLNRVQDALDALNNLDADTQASRSFQLLKAQILYRLGEYDQCAQLYKTLINDKNHKANDELYTNYSAALFLSKQYDECIDATKQSEENTYELSYNAACAAIFKNDFDAAQRYLDFAAKLCRESLEEDGYTEDEIRDELTSILVQTAFVMQVRGQNEEAAKLYRQVIEAKPKDAVSLAVAGNNLVSLEASSDSNVVDIEKKMKLATTPKVEGKLTTWQQRGINLNQTLLLIKKKRFDECRALLQKLQKLYPESDVPSIVSAAISFKEQKYDDAIASLQQYISQNANRDSEATLRVQLSLAQLHISRGNFEEAAALLEKTDVRNYPGIVGTLVALYERAKRSDDCVRVLNDSVQYWKQQQKQGNEKAEQNLITLLNASAEFKIRNERLDEAIQTYRSMVELDPENKQYIAGFVHALAGFDLEKAEQYATQLPELKTGDIDVARLEKESVRGLSDATATVNTTTVASAARTGADTIVRKDKSRRKKKNKLPKNYDPKKEPDPQRWLPKKERGTRSHQGSSSVARSQSLQAKKGQKKLLKPSDLGKQRKRV